jgi:hypothetical protein
MKIGPSDRKQSPRGTSGGACAGNGIAPPDILVAPSAPLVIARAEILKGSGARNFLRIENRRGFDA